MKLGEPRGVSPGVHYRGAYARPLAKIKEPIMQSILADFVADIRTAAADGLTLREIGTVLGNLARVGVQVAEQYQQASGPTKKSIVMEAIDQVLTVVVPMLPLPVWLRPFAPLVRRVLTSVLRSVADGLVESAVLHLPPAK